MTDIEQETKDFWSRVKAHWERDSKAFLTGAGIGFVIAWILPFV
jgi:hypothetical protein